MNWFKPFYTFPTAASSPTKATWTHAFVWIPTPFRPHGDNLAMFHGIYWHSDRYAVGFMV